MRVKDDHHDADEHGHGRSLSRAVRAFSGVTMLSRVGGLVRDVLLVHIFGGTALGSAFMAGFAIPNMFRRLFGEGALSAAFIPEYTAAERDGPGAADRFASLTVLWLGVVTGLLTALIEAGLLVALFVLPADADRELSIRLIMLMLPFMPLICISAILAGMLQVHGRFGPSASGPLVLNGFIIAVGLWHLLQGDTGGAMEAYALGTATVLSGLTQAVWFAWILRRHVRWTREFGDSGVRARRMTRKMLPVLVGLGTLQVNAFIDQLIAMWPIWVGPMLMGFTYPLDKSSGIILAASQRLYQFPLGVFGVAVATAAFPMLSRHASDPVQFAATLRRGVRLSLYIGLPASIGLMLVRDDLVCTLFRLGGESGFDAAAVKRASLVVLGYAPGIWAYSLNQVLTRAFYARGDTTTPMRLAVGMVVLNLLLNVGLIWPLSEAGLAWSTSICAMIQCVVLAYWCRGFLDGGRVLDKPTAVAVGRIVAAAVAMGLVVGLGVLMMPERTSWKMHAGSVAALTALGGVSYLGASRLLRLSELGWLMGRAGPGKPPAAVD